MQKIVKIFMLLLVAFGLVACKKTPTEEVKDKDFHEMIVNAQEEYKDSESVNVFITVITDNVTTTSELVYNFNGTEIANLAHKFVDGETEYAAYVKDGVAYVNINGVKSQGTLFDMEAEEVIKDYSFAGVTEVVFDAFDKSLMNALVVSEDANGVAKLTWDPSKYVLVTDGLEEDELDAAMQRFTDIQAKMEEISVTINYADNKVTKIESTWVTKTNKTSQINIELKGTSEQTIEYPNDLDEYLER